MLTKLGKYDIIAELGSGAMGVVYRAEDRRIGRPVALKVMSRGMLGNPEMQKRFYREAQAAGQLHHPNIVTIYDIDESEGTPFIAMEFLEGEDLEKIISSRRDVPVPQKLNIMMQTCRGLHYAHEHGVVHRDIKPGNIVVLKDGAVKIVDFGIARMGTASMTRTGTVLGTVMYMSPEQIRGEVVDARSDIFPVGIILYELLTYEVPFQGQDVPAILYKILYEQPRPLTELLPECRFELETIVLKALEKNREERYQTAEEMALELQGLFDILKRDLVGDHLAQGRRSIDKGKLTLAKESLQKVLEIDSSHELAKTLLDQVREQIETRLLEQKFEETLERAKAALQAEQYDEAIKLLEEILRLEPDYETAQRYLQQAVESRERRQKITRHMERAEKLSADGDFEPAQTELDAVLAIDPHHRGAQRMMDWVLAELTEQQRVRQIQQLIQQARTCLTSKEYRRALDLLEQARGLDPVNIEADAVTQQVRSAQEKEERGRQLDQRLNEIQAILKREEFDEALAVANQTLEEFPDEPEVVKLHTQVSRRAEQQKKRREVDGQLQAARDFLHKEDYAAASGVLEKALQTVPDDPRLVAFLQNVREAQQRAALEQQHREAVRHANELIRGKNFAGAVEHLEGVVARLEASPELNDLLQFAREQQAQQSREERLHQVLTEAQKYLRAEKPERAVRLLEQAQTELEASEIADLLASAREQQQKLEQKRAEARRREAAAAPRAPVARPAPETAAGMPVPEFAAARPSRLPLAIGAGVVLLALAGAGVWYFRDRIFGGGVPGTVQLVAAPWAEVVSVQSASGERVDISGQTPLEITLPPGEYVIELQQAENKGSVKVTVESGKVASVNYTFPEVPIERLVDEVVSQY